MEVMQWGPALLLYATQRGGVHAWDLRTRGDVWRLAGPPGLGPTEHLVVDPGANNWLLTGACAATTGGLRLWARRCCDGQRPAGWGVAWPWETATEPRTMLCCGIVLMWAEVVLTAGCNCAAMRQQAATVLRSGGQCRQAGLPKACVLTRGPRHCPYPFFCVSPSPSPCNPPAPLAACPPRPLAWPRLACPAQARPAALCLFGTSVSRCASTAGSTPQAAQ